MLKSNLFVTTLSFGKLCHLNPTLNIVLFERLSHDDGSDNNNAGKERNFIKVSKGSNPNWRTL